MKHCLLIFIFFVIYSCNNESSQSQGSNNEKEDKEKLNYAKGFDIKYENNHKLISINNPWQGAQNVKYDYLLLTRNIPLPEGASGYQVIRTPVERIVCLSTTHIAFIDVLHETKSKLIAKIKKNECLFGFN